MSRAQRARGFVQSAGSGHPPLLRSLGFLAIVLGALNYAVWVVTDYSEALPIEGTHLFDSLAMVVGSGSGIFYAIVCLGVGVVALYGLVFGLNYRKAKITDWILIGVASIGAVNWAWIGYRTMAGTSDSGILTYLGASALIEDILMLGIAAAGLYVVYYKLFASIGRNSETLPSASLKDT